jgi:hypothetical protein
VWTAADAVGLTHSFWRINTPGSRKVRASGASFRQKGYPMVALVSSPPQQRRQQELGRQVAAELHTVDARRFSRISVRGLLCGFVELDGVVSSFYAKSLALQIARNLPEVSGVVDLIRVVPTSGNRISST